MCVVAIILRDGRAELRRGGGLEIKIQHFVCFSGKFPKCFKAWLFQHYIKLEKTEGSTTPEIPRLRRDSEFSIYEVLKEFAIANIQNFNKCTDEYGGVKVE